MGYLHGDLGHSLQIEKKLEPAKQHFTASLAIWQELFKQQPQRAEYRELIDWCKMRLKDM
jgi:hypothetical protein